MICANAYDRVFQIENLIGQRDASLSERRCLLAQKIYILPDTRMVSTLEIIHKGTPWARRAINTYRLNGSREREHHGRELL